MGDDNIFLPEVSGFGPQEIQDLTDKLQVDLMESLGDPSIKSVSDDFTPSIKRHPWFIVELNPPMDTYEDIQVEYSFANGFRINTNKFDITFIHTLDGGYKPKIHGVTNQNSEEVIDFLESIYNATTIIRRYKQLQEILPEIKKKLGQKEYTIINDFLEAVKNPEKVGFLHPSNPVIDQYSYEPNLFRIQIILQQIIK